MSKIIKLPGRVESAEVGGIVTGANAIKDDAKGKVQSQINSETDEELLRLQNEKQDNITVDGAPTEGSNNPVASGGVFTAEKALSDAIEAILLLIPSAASELNKLADREFVASSIATSTATFKGTFNLVSDLHLSADATHEEIAQALGALGIDADANDYCFVQVPESDTSEDIKVTQRYKFNGTAWKYEYDLNNSGFTAEQWAAINSNITAALTAKLMGLPTSEVLAGLLAGKQDVLTFDEEPTAGSNNPVTSGGVFQANNDIIALINALDQAKQNVLTFDQSPVQGSSNPVTSGGVYDAIYLVQTVLVTLGGNVEMLQYSVGLLTEQVGILNTLYQALTQSDIIVGALPGTGVANRVYRVPGTSTYSDWMWYNGAWVKLAEYTTLDGYVYKGIAVPMGGPTGSAVKMFYIAIEPGTYSNFGNLVVERGINILKYDGANWSKDTIIGIDAVPANNSQNLVTSGAVFDYVTKNGGAYDISANNPVEGQPAVYETLSDALGTNGANVPVDVRKGGMSVKFIQGTAQSSDNKYVQYRLMLSTFTTAQFTNVANWQGVDVEPIDGSKNIPESGGTYKAIKRNTQELTDANVLIDQSISHDSGWSTYSPGYLLNKELIEIGNNTTLNWRFAYEENPNCRICFFDSSKNYISGLTGNTNSGIRTVDVPSGAAYVSASFASDCYSAGIYDSNNEPIFLVEKGSIQSQINSAEDKLVNHNYKVRTGLSGDVYPIKDFSLHKNEILYFSIKANNTISGTQLTLKITNPDGTTYRQIDEKIVYGNESKVWDGSELAYIYTPTEDKDDMLIGHHINNITKGVDITVNVKRMVISEQGDCVVYFAGAVSPTFETEGDGTTVTVTLPANKTMRLYYKFGSIYRDVNIGDTGNVFTLPYGRHLIYDLVDNTLKVERLSNSSNCIPLVSNMGDVLSGPLLGFYVKSIKDRVKKNTLSSISDQYTDAVRLSGNVYVDTSNGVITAGTMNRGIFYFPVKRGDRVHYCTSTLDGSNISSACIAVTSDPVPQIGSPVLEFKSYSGNPIDEIYEVQNDGTLYYYIFKTDIQVYSCNIISDTFNQALPTAFSIKDYWNTPDKVMIKDQVLNADFRFVFFSDIHGRSSELRRIIELANYWKSSLDFIIDGGDDTRVHQASTPLLPNWYNGLAEDSELPIIRAVGNHDAWTTGTWVWATPQQIYEYMTSDVVSLLREKGATVVQPSDAATAYRNYYYVDFGDIRVIVLLSLHFHNSDPYYDTDENTWFEGVLADAITNNKNVICVNHGPLNPTDCDEIPSNWTSYNSWKEYDDNQHINPAAVSAVDSFMSNGGKFICWLTGHSHSDFLLKTNNSQNVQFCFTTSCARGTTLDGVQPQYRTSKGYDLFNVIGVDLTNKFVKIWRIGFNTNNALQEHNTLCYDYENQRIVSET